MICIACNTKEVAKCVCKEVSQSRRDFGKSKGDIWSVPRPSGVLNRKIFLAAPGGAAGGPLSRPLSTSQADRGAPAPQPTSWLAQVGNKGIPAPRDVAYCLLRFDILNPAFLCSPYLHKPICVSSAQLVFENSSTTSLFQFKTPPLRTT
jgi:hypothetical protein